MGVAEFTNYVEEIIGNELKLKNIVALKLIKEFIRMNKESESTDEITAIKKRLIEMEARENDIRKRDENKITDLQKRMSLCETKIVKCSNCRCLDCQHDILVQNVHAGMKVRSYGPGHICRKDLGEGEAPVLHIPRDTVGFLDNNVSVEWNIKGGKVKCTCAKKTSGWENVVYKCD